MGKTVCSRCCCHWRLTKVTLYWLHVTSCAVLGSNSWRRLIEHVAVKTADLSRLSVCARFRSNDVVKSIERREESELLKKQGRRIFRPILSYFRPKARKTNISSYFLQLLSFFYVSPKNAVLFLCSLWALFHFFFPLTSALPCHFWILSAGIGIGRLLPATIVIRTVD